MIKSFKDLVVWQKSFQHVKDVYALSAQLPREEMFGLSSQIRRCAVSIPSNIAEGQQRNNIKEYRQFLGIAKGSAGELETQLLLMSDLYNIDCTKELACLEEIQRMLQSLLVKLINSHLSPRNSNLNQKKELLT